MKKLINSIHNFYQTKSDWKNSLNSYNPSYILNHIPAILLKKNNRLQGKEVRFLTRKRQVHHQSIFTIFFAPQYPNRSYHQISFHIPVLLSKRAVKRHKVKRILIKAYEKLTAQKEYQQTYFKCFVTIQKNKLEQLSQFLINKQDDQLENYLTQQRNSAFTSFLNRHENSTINNQVPYRKNNNTKKQ